jgi:acetyl-CoA carboxylase biotin carboxylase subunit
VKKFKRVLIANRGEIAVRVARTLRELGITPIAVFSDADRIAPHVRACDFAVHIGAAPSPESYLCQDKIVAAAKKTGADAIHPGYGFLSENAGFAQAVSDAGLVFIGPKPEAIRAMGSKTAAREAMQKAGVPVVPGSDKIKSVDDARAAAKAAGYPVMLKASAGGGGKGMRIVHNESELASALRGAQSEAKNAFGDESVYLEKAILRPRHIEIQIMAGPNGKAVWLGERECSMQRRHQKVIEETPSAVVDEKMRRAMGEVACKAAEAVGYVGAGTIEFLVDEDRTFYFLEMNTRLQVEHPVTELCCGVDLVETQVRVAQGEPLPWSQDQIQRRGHAIEARLYAEDPNRNFMPCPGYIDELILPAGPGVRVDAGVVSRYEVPRFYDPMIAKIAVWAEDRPRAIRRMERALAETAVKGITTNSQFLRRLVSSHEFAQGRYHTGTIAEVMAAPAPEVQAELTDLAVAAMVANRLRRDREAVGQSSKKVVPLVSNWATPQWKRFG